MVFKYSELIMDGLERIKVLSSEIKDKALLKIIDYLLSREDMNEKYLSEEKSIKEMISFIKSEARKSASDGMAMIEDEVVYSWAIHYFDETNKNLNITEKQTKTKVKTENIKEKEKVKVTKQKKKEEKNWQPEGQLTLFDFM